MSTALAAGSEDLPQLLHSMLVLTLCQLSGSASVQPIVQSMAERAGFATLLKMVGKQMAVHHMVHIWGPTACRWGCAGILCIEAVLLQWLNSTLCISCLMLLVNVCIEVPAAFWVAIAAQSTTS